MRKMESKDHLPYVRFVSGRPYPSKNQMIEVTKMIPTLETERYPAARISVQQTALAPANSGLRLFRHQLPQT
jgi:hypothetical protein